MILQKDDSLLGLFKCIHVRAFGKAKKVGRGRASFDAENNHGIRCRAALICKTVGGHDPPVPPSSEALGKRTSVISVLLNKVKIIITGENGEKTSTFISKDVQ